MSFRGSCTRNGVGSRTGEGRNSIFADPLLGSREAAKARSHGEPSLICDGCVGIQSTSSVGLSHQLPIQSTG
jgi:hypothetical protein